MEQTIFRSDRYAVDYFPAISRTGRVAVTFTERSVRTLNGKGFGGDVLTNNGFDVVAYKGNSDRWYGDLPDAALDATNVFLAAMPVRHHSRVSFGSSMGAYAAIMFAKRLSIDIALALSPQFDVTAPWDTRWSSYVEGLMRTFTHEDVRQECAYVIVFDPHDDDRLHYDKFAEVIPPELLHPVKVPYSGHPCGFAIAAEGGGKFKAFVIRTLNGGSVVRSIRVARSAPQYIFQLASRCADTNHLTWANSLMKRLTRQQPLNAEFAIRAAIIAARCGQTNLAIAQAALAVAVNPKHPHMTMTLAHILRQAGQSAPSLHYMNVALALLPDVADWVKDRDDLASSV